MGHRAIAILLLLAAAAAGEEPVRLAVSVVGANGRPVGAGRVELHRVAQPVPSGRSYGFVFLPIDAPPAPASTAPIGAGGEAVIPDLSPGVWRVVAFSPGHAPAEAIVRWTTGLPAPRVRLTAVPGAVLEGRVRRVDGSVLAGVAVAATMKGTSFGPASPSHQHVVRSDGEGRYRIDGLAPGDYLLWTRRPGTGWLRGGRVRVPGVARHDFRLFDGARAEGHVTEAGTGKPVAGATVSIVGDAFSPREGPLARATTDEDGRFAVLTHREFVNAGGMRVEADGFRTAIVEDTDFWNLPDGKVLKRDFELVKGRDPGPPAGPEEPAASTVTVTGTVRDDAGDPVPLADVGSAGTWTLTDADGGFRVEAPVRPGWALVLRVSKEGYGAAESDLSPDAPVSLKGVDIVLERAPVLTGRVTSSRKADVAGARVLVAQLWNDRQGDPHADWENVPGTTVEDDGTYRLHLPTLGEIDGAAGAVGSLGNEFVVCVLAPGHGPAISGVFPIPEGERELRVDLTLPPGLSLAGRIVEYATGEPVAAQPILLSPEGGRWNDVEWPPALPPSASVGEATSDPDGRWRIADLGPGRYSVGVRRPGFAEEWEEIELPRKEPLEIGLRTLEPLAGVVLRPDGKPAAGFRVWLESEEGWALYDPWEVEGPTTDAKGRFRLPRERAGRYWIHVFRGEGSSLAPARHGPVSTGDEEIVIRLVEGRKLEGRLLDAAGEPLSGIDVTVKPEVGEGPWLAGETDEDGRFAVTPVPPGRQAVFFEEAGETVHGVDPGRPLVHRLTGTLTISGRVVPPDGVEIEGIELTARRVEGPAGPEGVTREHVVFAAEDGTFEFRYLPPGHYEITGDVRGFGAGEFRVRDDVRVAAGATDLAVPLVRERVR